MADVQTTDINTKPTVTTIDSNDQIYISDGGTALKKISYTNLAKAIIEQYNASQLAGATKTIQTAFNELNSKLGNTLSDGTNLDALTLPVGSRSIRYYHAQNIKDMSGYPTATEIGNWPFCLEVIPIGTSETYTKQVLHLYGTYTTPDNVYERTQTYVSDGTSWSPWVKRPTRAEMIKIKDYALETSSDISAGAVGERGAQVSLPLGEVSANNVVAISIVSISDSSSYHPIVFISGSNIYCNYYRTTSNAVSKNVTKVTARVAYYNG